MTRQEIQAVVDMSLRHREARFNALRWFIGIAVMLNFFMC